MTPALGIGVSSLNADRTAIQATSENISNAQTPGYVRESAQMSALPGGGLQGVGDGVEVTTVAQATSALLSANNWQAQGALSRLGSLQQTLSAVENVFPLATQPGSASATGTSATSSASISGQLATFWSSWDAIAQSPSALAPRTQVVNEAQSLVVSFHEAATQLSQISSNVGKQLTDQVTQVNALLGQAASLNQSIVTTKGAMGNPNQLQDQLNQVIGTLSQLAGVDVRTQSDGAVTIAIGGVTVVQGDTVTKLQLVPPSTATHTYAVTTTSGIPVGVGSGSIAGLLQAANQYIPKYLGQLNAVATSLATAVNEQLAQGYTATWTKTGGTSGKAHPLFVGATGTHFTATGIAVSTAVAADPALIAASAQKPPPTTPPVTPPTPNPAANTGANAQAMAELATAQTFPGSTPLKPTQPLVPTPTTAKRPMMMAGARYQTLVQGMGADTQGVDSQLAAQTSVAAQAQQALQSVSGVNLDQELSNLLGYQQNYEASAKLLATVDATVQSLLQAV